MIDADIKPHQIDVKFFAKSSGQSAEVINNIKPELSIKGQSRQYRFEFAEPVYITNISIECSGYDSIDKFEIQVHHVDGTNHDERVRVNGDEVNLRLGKLSSGFSFKPDPKWLSNTQIHKISVHGFTLDEFHKLEWSVKEISAERKRLDSREVELDGRELEIEALVQKKADLEKSVGTLTAEASKLATEQTQFESKIASAEAQFDNLTSKISSIQSERRILVKDIEDNQAELRKIKTEVRLFPSEITGFVKEGNSNIIWYVGIGVPFAIILGIILKSLFSSAIDLTQLWRADDNVDVWIIFLTRIPFVLVAMAMIEACGYIVGRLVYEIMRINRQRLEFAKLSIIAKDVSAASSTGTDLSEDEVFELETKLKMELLREHMKNHSQSEFDYKGSAFITAIIGVAERLTGKKDA